MVKKIIFNICLSVFVLNIVIKIIILQILFETKTFTLMCLMLLIFYLKVINACLIYEDILKIKKFYMKIKTLNLSDHKSYFNRIICFTMKKYLAWQYCIYAQDP